MPVPPRREGNHWIHVGVERLLGWNDYVELSRASCAIAFSMAFILLMNAVHSPLHVVLHQQINVRRPPEGTRLDGRDCLQQSSRTRLNRRGSVRCSLTACIERA